MNHKFKNQTDSYSELKEYKKKYLKLVKEQQNNAAMGNHEEKWILPFVIFLSVSS